MIPPELHVKGAVGTLPEPVTHCMRVAEGDLEQAVLGEIRAQAAPNPGVEKWHILPTVRFNDLVCAEVTVANFLAYFIPETEDSPQNVNLVVGWSIVSPHPLYCGNVAWVRAPVVNTGQDWFDTPDGHITMTVRDIHVSSTIVTAEYEYDIGTSLLGPGDRRAFNFGPLLVDTYVNELHRLEITADFFNEVDEISETDNVWFTEYYLSFPPEYDKCEPPPLTGSYKDCKFRFHHRHEGDNQALLAAFEDLEEAYDMTTEGETSLVTRLQRAVKDEYWELMEWWFVRPRRKIIEALIESINDRQGAIRTCLNPDG